MAGTLEQLLKDYTLSQIPLLSGIVVDEGAPVEDVAKLMREQNVGCVVLTKQKELTGIFTERDLLQRVVGQVSEWTSPIREFSTLSPVMMKSKEPLRKALALMKKKNFRHIPILEEDGSLKGILSVQNVIQFLAEHFPAEVINLPPRVTIVPKTVDGG